MFVQEEEARLAPWMWVLSSFIPETAIYQAAGGYQLARAIDSRALRAVIARIATFLTLAEVLALAASSRTNTYVTIVLRFQEHFNLKFAPEHTFPMLVLSHMQVRHRAERPSGSSHGRDQHNPRVPAAAVSRPSARSPLQTSSRGEGLEVLEFQILRLHL